MGFYEESFNTCSRLLFRTETIADVEVGLDEMQHDAISLPHTGYLLLRGESLDPRRRFLISDLSSSSPRS